MPLLNKFISTRTINKKSQDSKVPVKLTISTNSKRSGLHFGVDQVRVLLFRECEWRGRKLLFDSVTVGNKKVNNAQEHGPKRYEATNSCPRNGNGLPQASEKEACDNLSLLSELVFGTVAMTYRGPLFKIHKLDSPTCIMCTKVIPASDHYPHKQNSGKLSDDALGIFPNIDFTSSNGSIRNNLFSPSSGNFSGNSLRKSSTSSSTCSGWDIDVSLFRSSQSLESNSSSGFGSLSSIRRRWLRAISTSLIHSDTDEIFGFQPYIDHCGDVSELNVRKHKTRLGLAVLIKLTPGEERQMEVRLLEHAAQLEAMLNRLCFVCIQPTQCKINDERRGLVLRLHQASVRCTLWLLRLLMTAHNTVIPSIWHEVLLNSSTCVEIRANTLYRTFQQMCQLLNHIDTKSTNFFVSTLVTAVLTYHLGWVNTVMSPYNQTWIESIKKYPTNPFWIQLGDLYGTIGNPSKLVHTVITGDPEKVTLINAVLTFLSYFIRSGLIQKRHETRTLQEEDVQKAVTILEKNKRKHSSILSKNSRSTIRVKPIDTSSCSVLKSTSRNLLINRSLKKSFDLEDQYKDLGCTNISKGPENLTIPQQRKTSSLNMNLDSHSSSVLKMETKVPIKLESCQDDFTDYSSSLNEKDNTSNAVKIMVSQIASENFVTEKEFPRTSSFNEFEIKQEWRDTESSSVASKLSFLHNQSDNGFDTTKSYVPEEIEVYFSQVEHSDRKQSQVRFTLGEEDKTSVAVDPPSQSNFNCQCSFAFTRVPSTSAELPDDVLRKILQRNFPESSKSIQRQPGTSFGKERVFGYCPKCNRSGNVNYEGSSRLLETPTNATEVLRTCGNSVSTRGARQRRTDSMEELLEANDVVEVPMPRSKSIPAVSNDFELSGFTNTLLQREVTKPLKNNSSLINDSQYVPGLVIQGLTRRKCKRKGSNSNEDKDLIAEIREEVSVAARFPMVDEPVSEALCILADLDTWQVGILSNNMSLQTPILPVGMSRLVSNMLEVFLYLGTKYQSPTHCLNILECKLREMFLRSEALTTLLITTDVCDINISSIMHALDVDAADIPLLLAVATTSSPQIAQRFGLTLT